MQLLYQDHYRFRFSDSITTLDYRPHLHSAVEIVVLTAGSCLVQYGGEKTRLSAGDLFVSFPNQIHGYEESRDIKGYLLIVPVKPYLAVYYGTLIKKQPITPFLRRGQWEEESLLSVLRLGIKELPTASETVMQGYLQIIMGKLLDAMDLQEASSGNEDALKKVLMYLNGHYTEAITRREIAKAVGYHESYLSHIFRQGLGTTIPEYVNGLRCYDAIRLLKGTDMPVTQIALQLGFGSVRNFNRAFLKQTGMTPRSCRGEEK